MKKQRIQLIVLIVVLIALAGGYFGLKQYNKAQSEKPAEPAGEAIVNVSLDDIIKLSYDYEENSYEYDKADGTWYYTPNHDLNLTQYRLENMAEKLAGLTALETINDVTDMSQYGLDDPSRTLSFETAGESFIFNVGDYNEIAGVYYICRPSATTVYAVESSVITAFNVDVMDMVEEEEESTEGSTEESIEGTEGTESTDGTGSTDGTDTAENSADSAENTASAETVESGTGAVS